MRLLAFTTFFLAVALHAQSGMSSKWAGEWGSYKEGKAGQEMRSEGQRLSITSCLGDTCQTVISTALLSGDHCDGAGDLHIYSETRATLTLQGPAQNNKACVLELAASQGDQRAISVKRESGNCGFYCTPKCNFERVFPFRSATPFVGNDIPGCYLARSKALTAVCMDRTLSDLQGSWMTLSDSVNALYGKPPNAAKRRDEAQTKCSAAEDPAGCLRAVFREDSERLLHTKAQWQASVTDPGNSAEAARKAAAIRGVYTHSFKNRMVSGEQYPSTNRLEIQERQPDSIQFKAELSFSNGHSCRVEGDAAYKRNGAFVFRSAENGESCVLEILATENGVEFEDPLGGCKSYCGARGSLGGAKFSYSDRTK